ncbi:MAG: hypothetical protein IPM39_27405 [Chloroflexi bacterium]|nr:hypothetical protein [Chloroflexota bacterium]
MSPVSSGDRMVRSSPSRILTTAHPIPRKRKAATAGQWRPLAVGDVNTLVKRQIPVAE